MRGMLIAVGLLVGAIVLGATLVDEGEVVMLTTTGADGVKHETPLWIVERGGAAYLRAGTPGAGWLARLRADPSVELERDEVSRPFTAVPDEDPATRTEVNALMAEKYGLSDRLWSQVLDRTRSVPVRLEPRAAP